MFFKVILKIEFSMLEKKFCKGERTHKKLCNSILKIFCTFSPEMFYLLFLFNNRFNYLNYILRII